MASPLIELARAERRYAFATPGSREWWRAIRDIRVARRRIGALFSGMAATLARLAQSVREAFGSILDAVSSLAESLEVDD